MKRDVRQMTVPILLLVIALWAVAYMLVQRDTEDQPVGPLADAIIRNDTNCVETNGGTR